MIFKIVLSNRFKKDLKIAKKRGLDLDQLKTVVNKLANGEKLEKKYRDHGLVGDYAGFRECHLQISASHPFGNLTCVRLPKE